MSEHAVRHLADRVENAVDDHTRPEHPRAYAATDEPASRRDLRIEQRRETDEAFGPVTRAQAHGVVAGGVVGALLGAAVCWPFGFVSWGAGIGLAWRILATALIGAFAFAVGFVVYLGGRMPELEGETMSGDNQPMDGTTPADPRNDERGRPLRAQ